MLQKTTSFDEERILQTSLAYDHIAEAYAETWFDDPVMEAILDRFLNLLPVTGGVLDAGCGPGRDVLAMAKRGVEAVGIDNSRAMVSEARERVPEGVFRWMDMRSVKYPSESFAGIWACSSLQHLPPRSAIQALSEFERSLRPNGVICVIVEEGQGDWIDHLGRYQKFYSAAELREYLSRTGFQILEERTVSSSKVTLGEERSRNWLHVLATKPPTSKVPLPPGQEHTCPFCSTSRFQLQQQVGLPGITSILWGDDDIYVAPDIAPLLEGHLLMISSYHYDCYGALPERFYPAVRVTQQRVRQMFNEIYHDGTLFFEHGPAHFKEAGACINHAHWHCLPKSLPIRHAIEKYVGPGQAATLDTLSRLYGDGQSYLYLEEETSEGFAYPIRVLPCQFLREVVGSLIGHQNWGWQLNYDSAESKDVFRRTLNRLFPIADSLLLSTEMDR